ncbi:MAG TPA: hypothetical protein VK200_02890 [Candidatus Limnocylindrales bacterium]|nr:hypothetical protein [Candidatus Limnocylindrales bacterium]
MLAAAQTYALTFVLVISLWIGIHGAATAQQKAMVFGTATANLRAWAGVEHELKAVLKEGDQVSVEQSTGERYLVLAADGQKGYVHKNLLKLAADVTPQPAAPQSAPAKINSTETKEPAKDANPTAIPAAAPPAPAKEAPKPPPAPAPVPRVEPPKVPEAKSQSILQMLEGHETEVKLGVIIAAIVFVLGWLCGVGYQARRERKSRHKLRF